jgi:hypothetical protein
VAIPYGVFITSDWRLHTGKVTADVCCRVIKDPYDDLEDFAVAACLSKMITAFEFLGGLHSNPKVKMPAKNTVVCTHAARKGKLILPLCSSKVLIQKPGDREPDRCHRVAFMEQPSAASLAGCKFWAAAPAAASHRTGCIPAWQIPITDNEADACMEVSYVRVHLSVDKHGTKKAEAKSCVVELPVMVNSVDLEAGTELQRYMPPSPASKTIKVDKRALSLSTVGADKKRRM